MEGGHLNVYISVLIGLAYLKRMPGSFKCPSKTKQDCMLPSFLPYFSYVYSESFQRAFSLLTPVIALML